MYKVIALDENGQKQQLLCLGEYSPLPDLPDDWTFVLYDGSEDDIAKIEVVSVAGTPTIRSKVVTIGELSAKKWNTVKALREAKIMSGVDVPGIGKFDSTPKAIQDVAGAALSALIMVQSGLGDQVVATWTMFDDSERPITASEMITVQLTGTAYIDGVHSRARELRGLIAAATSPEELDAIPIYDGWP